jgi:HK97 family phage major capsid protein
MKTLHFVAVALACVISMFVGAAPAMASGGELLALSGIAGTVMAGGAVVAPRMAMTALERKLGRFLRGPDGHEPEGDGRRQIDPEQIAEQLRKSIDAKHDDVMKKAEAAVEEAKKAGGLSAETKASVDEALTSINVLREQLAEIEQKMARKPGADGDQVKSLGEQLAGSDKFKSFQSGGYQGSVRIALSAPGGIKAVTTASLPASTERDPEVVSLPRREMTVRDLLTVVPTDSGTVEFARQTTRTNNAAPVAEGATKPTSDYVWELVSTPVRVIAHLAKISRQAMDDHRQLQGEVEQEMRYGLMFAEENQLLNGDGTGQNIDGLIANATAYAAPFDPAGTETAIDILRLALLQAELALYASDGIVLNSADWARIELTKDADGRYIIGQPQGSIDKRLWGKRVVATPAIAVDKFLVGGFKLQTLYDRMAPEVLIASENAEDFEKNLYTMRCEERIALGVKRPAALIYGDLGFVA